ncbi:MAG: CDP-alcohol phosphatidyltransferase family protein [Bacteroidetes bacterium]|nr:CDP-alcohol phosphatidyltransferase family protein [Bacteroidota bacterium]
MKNIGKQIPNILSGWRLLSFPLVMYFIFTLQREAFILLLSINLITDILDGLIARVFKLQTNFGARLDSMADMGTYIAAFTAFIYLEWSFVSEKGWAFSMLVFLWILPQVISLIRFHRLPHFHLWSNKFAGYLQGIFIFTYFNWGNSELYFWVMWSVSVLAFLEELIVVLYIQQLRSNLKGIFWMMREQGKIA